MYKLSFCCVPLQAYCKLAWQCAWCCGCLLGIAGPIKALVQERQMDWQARFGQALGLKVIQLTGDDDSLSLDDLESADIICSTPEKFGELVSWTSHSHAPCFKQ
jgi:hypothetical protein